jgi:hypothetical protein
MLRIGDIYSEITSNSGERRFAGTTIQQLPVYDSPAALVVHCAVAFAECPIVQCAGADSRSVLGGNTGA